MPKKGERIYRATKDHKKIIKELLRIKDEKTGIEITIDELLKYNITQLIEKNK